MSVYEYLMNKADRCIKHARYCESDWARKFWVNIGCKLQDKANNLLLKDAEKKVSDE